MVTASAEILGLEIGWRLEKQVGVEVGVDSRGREHEVRERVVPVEVMVTVLVILVTFVMEVSVTHDVKCD